jgi:hypothetical protein
MNASRRPFTEQVAFFRGKLGKLVPTTRWDDLDRAEHDTAFMVAGAQKADLLADLAASVDRAIVDGKSLDAFRKDFEAAVERNDWHGWTGEGTKGGRAWRTRTIYRTNAATSYAAGRRAQLEAGNFPLWIYRHGNSRDPRPEHVSWDGLVLPPDHPFWVKHSPPSEWGCSCYVLGARSARAARRLGGDPDKPLPAGWDTIDPATGAPPGVGRGWDYAPGASVSGTVRAAAAKISSWDHRIGKAFYESLPVPARDALAQAYRRLPSVADDTRRYARRVLGQGKKALIEEQRTVGLLTSDEAEAVRELVGTDVAGYDLSVSRSVIGHIEGVHGVEAEREQSQRGVVVEDYARLPEVVAHPDRIEKGTTDDVVVYSRMIEGELYVAVFVVRGKKRRTLELKTMYIKRRKG